MRAVAAAAAALILAAPAAAVDRYDTQPDIGTGWCPGGHNVNQLGLEQCDGADYPGGMFWRQERARGGATYRMCVSHERNLFGMPKPAHGCGYAL